MKKKIKSLLILIVKIGAIALILFFLARKLIESWDQVSQYSFDINYTLMILSLIILCVGYVSVAYNWRLILPVDKSKLVPTLSLSFTVIIKLYFSFTELKNDP